MKDFYGRRLQYHWPQRVTRPWLPRVHWRGMSDEFCNPSVLLVLPLLGAIVVFYGWRLRMFDDGWCWECREVWNEQNPTVPYRVGIVGVSNGQPILLDRADYIGVR